MAPGYKWARDEEATAEDIRSFADYFPHYKLQIFLLCVVIIIVIAYLWRKCKRYRRRRREIERRTLLSEVERIDYCDCRILRQKSIPGAVWVKRQCPLHRTRPWTVTNELQYSQDVREYNPRGSLDSGFHSPISTD